MKKETRYKCSRCGSLDVGSPMGNPFVKVECLRCGHQKLSRADCHNNNSVPTYNGRRKPRNAEVIEF